MSVVALDQTTLFERTTPTVPIFVDESGRKSRRARHLGRAVRICVLAYFSMVVASFAGVSLVPRLSLPGIGTLSPPTAPPGLPPLAAGAMSTPTHDLEAPSQPARPSARQAPSSGAGTTGEVSTGAQRGVRGGAITPEGSISPGSMRGGTGGDRKSVV